MKRFAKVLSLVLALSMLLGAIPASAMTNAPVSPRAEASPRVTTNGVEIQPFSIVRVNRDFTHFFSYRWNAQTGRFVHTGTSLGIIHAGALVRDWGPHYDVFIGGHVYAFITVEGGPPAAHNGNIGRRGFVRLYRLG